MKTRNWKRRITQDGKYYKEYKNHIYHNAEMKGDMNVFVTLKGLRRGCNIYLRSRWFQKRFEEILSIYGMNYLCFDNDDSFSHSEKLQSVCSFGAKTDDQIEYFISKRKFSKKVRSLW